MPRVPVHREPKPQPHRRSHDGDTRRRSHDYDHHSNGHVENGHGHSNTNTHGKRKISTLTGHLVAATGEFVGTFMFLYFAFAGQIMIVTQASEVSLANGLASSHQNIFTALLYGFSLLVNAWAFYRISGGLFNPAVRSSHSSFTTFSLPTGKPPKKMNTR
jgi:aquaporin related protein